MELDKIFKLIDAGYTKEEIQAFETEEKPAETEPAQPAQEAPAEPAPEAPAPAVQNDEILQAINKLTQAIITKNLNGTTAETVQERTTSDILAKVIAPPVTKKGK